MHSKVSRIIGRHDELQKLADFYAAVAPQFMAIYGRRRIGKTFLVREYFSDKDCCLFEVTGKKKGSLKHQLQIFRDSFESCFNKTCSESLDSWRAAFLLLTKELQNSEIPIIIFLDEFPWLACKGSNLLSELEYFWNSIWSKIERAKLIICGSSAGWIVEKIINDKGGLHNRVTSRIALQPFLLNETKEFLDSKKLNYTSSQILELYLALGGVPFYLNAVKPGFSPEQNIQNLCFSEGGMLREEFSLLFSSLFDNSEKHLNIVNELSKSRYGISRKDLEAKISKTSGGQASTVLNQLEVAGFIKGYVPFGKKKKYSYYRLIDEYSLFYKRFIEPTTQGRIGISENYWSQIARSQAYSSWAGYGFETVCHKNYASLLRSLGISGIQVSIYSWRFVISKDLSQNLQNVDDTTRGAQIDMLLDRADSTINLCDIKYTREPYYLDKEEQNRLKMRASIFREQTKTNKAINWILISANGVRHNEYSREIFLNTLDVEDLYRTR